MANNIVALAIPKKKNDLPEDLPGILRKLADDVESGSVTQLIIAGLQDDQFFIMTPSSIYDNIILATHISRRTTNMLYEG